MKNKITKFLIVLTFLMLTMVGCHQVDETKRPNIPNNEEEFNNNYELIFRDDFNIFNENVWKKDLGARRGGYWHPDQVTVQDGNMIIRTQYNENGEFGPAYYTGSVYTKILNDIPFGYYEIRFKTQRAKGYWQAIWLMQDTMGNVGNGARDGAEIDIIEIHKQDTFQNTLHYDGYDFPHHRTNAKTTKVDNLVDEWHVVALEWTPEYMGFIFDGVVTYEFTDSQLISQVNKGTFIISAEINGAVENGIPNPNKSTWLDVGNITTNGKDFSQDFVIDYVKVYQHKNNKL